MTNLETLQMSSKENRREILTEYFSRWAGVGDSYIYDLTRVKEAFAIGTMSFDDFSEWDADRVAQLVDEFLEWLDT